VGRVERGRVLAGWFLALASGWLAIGAPAVFGQDANAVCDSPERPDWATMPDVSSTAPGQNFLCNYAIDRETGVSGTAITIEYYCSAQEGSERFQGVRGDGRETETTPDGAPAGLMIIEEGPKAANPDNPQSEGVFSIFFPDPFSLMEKEWVLLNPQVFATIVVNTNERDVLEEVDRFGVDDAEPVARMLANRHRGTMPCTIPEVPGGSELTSGSGVPGLPVIVLVGTGVVLIGGYEVWRRRRKPGEAPAGPTSRTRGPSTVPPQCRGLETLHESAIARQAVLEEAVTDLTQVLEKAEKIHRTNILKANVAVGWEIMSTIGGIGTDVALALRPAVLRHAPPGLETDSWKPKGPISQKLTHALQQAGDAADAAVSRLKALSDELTQSARTIVARVADSPAVKQAQEAADAAFEALKQMEKRFELSEAARKQLGELETAMSSMDDVGKLTRQMEGLEDQILDKRAQLRNTLDLIKDKQGTLPADLKAARDKLRNITPTLDGAGMDKTIDPVLQRQIDDAGDAVDYMAKQLAKIDGSAEIAEATKRAKALEAELATLTQDLHNLKEPLAVASAEAVRQDRWHTELLQEVLKHGDVLKPEVDIARARLERARAALAESSRERFEALNDELWQLRAQVDAADAKAAAAKAQLDDLRASIDVGPSLITLPFTIVSEIVFGVGQSPAEIMDFLIQGRQNILITKSRLSAVRRALRNQQTETRKLADQLRACVAANTGHAVPAPVADPVAAAVERPA
jgi:hypothetical protein